MARWRAHLAQADVMFDFDWMDPAAIPANAPRVRWIQATSSGIGEFLDRTGLRRSEITFTTAAGVHSVPLAEFVVLGLLYFAKGVPDLRAWQAEHRWQRYATGQLAGKRVLLIGLGRVGRQIARTLDALGVEVWGMARSTPSESLVGVRRIVARNSLDQALADIDALILACPYTAETHHLIGIRQLDAMPARSILVNIARGAVVQEDALIEALREGRLAGAFLDVFEHEPLPAGSPLWDMPNVLVSPHSASTVRSENSLIVDLFLENLRRYLEGLPLVNRFEPERGY
jgi:glyoxylate/hydroxypyruvate reductase A